MAERKWEMYIGYGGCALFVRRRAEGDPLRHTEGDMEDLSVEHLNAVESALEAVVRAGCQTSDEFGTRCYYCGEDEADTPEYAEMQRINLAIYQEYLAEGMDIPAAMVAAMRDPRRLPWPAVSRIQPHLADCVWAAADAVLREAGNA